MKNIERDFCRVDDTPANIAASAVLFVVFMAWLVLGSHAQAAEPCDYYCKQQLIQNLKQMEIQQRQYEQRQRWQAQQRRVQPQTYRTPSRSQQYYGLPQPKTDLYNNSFFNQQGGGKK